LFNQLTCTELLKNEVVLSERDWSGISEQKEINSEMQSWV